MRRTFLLGAVLVLAAGPLLPTATADTPLTPQQQEQARQWVRQLADHRYKTRGAAFQKLFELGRAAVPALEQGAKAAAEPEVRRRCEELLRLARRTDTEVALALFLRKKDDSLLLKLPAWDRFGKVAGADDAAKRLFVEMFSLEGDLLAEQDKDPKAFAPKFQAHLQKIQQTLFDPWTGETRTIPHAQVVALLFMATDPNVPKDPNRFYLFSNLFHQPSVQQGFADSAGSRRLLVAFLEQRANAQTGQQVFSTARQMDLKEALPLALKTLKDQGVPGRTRGAAVLFVGSMGGKEHAPELEKLLEDSAVLGSTQVGFEGGRVETLTAQTRDVALAALILVSGQSVYDYPFPYIRQAGFRDIRKKLALPFLLRLLRREAARGGVQEVQGLAEEGGGGQKEVAPDAPPRPPVPGRDLLAA